MSACVCRWLRRCRSTSGGADSVRAGRELRSKPRAASQPFAPRLSGAVGDLASSNGVVIVIVGGRAELQERGAHGLPELSMDRAPGQASQLRSSPRVASAKPSEARKRDLAARDLAWLLMQGAQTRGEFS